MTFVKVLFFFALLSFFFVFHAAKRPSTFHFPHG